MLKEFPYKRVIAYGCSWTAGSELSDHIYLNLKEDDLWDIVAKHKINTSEKLFKFLNLSEELIEKIHFENSKLSWPNHIAEYFNIPCINKSIPGTSLGVPIYQILKDYHSNEIKHNDLILIGITSPYRWFMFDEYGMLSYGVMGHGWTGNLEKKFHKNLEEYYFNDYNVLYNHMKDINFLSNLSDLKNRQIRMAHMWGTLDLLRNLIKESHEHEDFKGFYNFCKDSLSNHNILISDLSLSELTNGPMRRQTHYVFGHVRVNFHILMANLIIKELLSEFSYKKNYVEI